MSEFKSSADTMGLPDEELVEIGTEPEEYPLTYDRRLGLDRRLVEERRLNGNRRHCNSVGWLFSLEEDIGEFGDKLTLEERLAMADRRGSQERREFISRRHTPDRRNMH